METTIIDKEAIRKTWPLSKNLNDDRLDPFILRAQQRYLKPFLGEALYYDFITNLAETHYQTLLNGEPYEVGGHTVFFSGVEPMLAAFAYGLFIRENPIHVNRAGNKNKTDENSVEISAQTTAIKSNEGKSEGIRLQDETRRFLETNRSDYPLYNKGVNINQETDQSFSFSKVPRSVQR